MCGTALLHGAQPARILIPGQQSNAVFKMQHHATSSFWSADNPDLDLANTLLPQLR